MVAQTQHPFDSISHIINQLEPLAFSLPFSTMYEQKWFWHIHTITEEDLENKQSKKNIDMRVISHKKTFCV